ncbi:BgTH12-05545 [Blumeria graminis f. sp. triticale]|uniref:BgTH12-05545 n=1 Tax=Blumeria graminis f. sp. triticale TaxID=1689686 RepID=A0A9W4D320_BLUGR|nr:BgTH12-05545 [Blumeria graminis f. sp. triticale]
MPCYIIFYHFRSQQLLNRVMADYLTDSSR